MGASPPVLTTELDYPADSADLFEAVADWPWAMFLDSAARDPRHGRHDLIVADPYLTFLTRGPETLVRDRRGLIVARHRLDPLGALRQYWAGARSVIDDSVPFRGGAVGWFGYDLGGYMGDWPLRGRAADALPEMAVGLYDWAVVVDHQARRAWLAGGGNDAATAAKWGELEAIFSNAGARAVREPLRATGDIVASLSPQAYRAGVEKVHAYLAAGDCYQVNFTQTFRVPVRGDTWAGYRTLRRLNPAPFAAYLNTPEARVLSSSPERFLAVDSGRVETRPIKGTTARRADPVQDAAAKAALAASAKDRAENVMIVDLLRNDLGRVCRTGSVAVPELWTVESFASVHHLVSTVTGVLADGCDPLHLLAACFPGGSITGAPKRRAMAIIDELEAGPRGLYCGSIGYLGFNGRMDTNIAIRTLVVRNGEASFGAGGGIVIDSDPEAEYQESLIKAERLVALFE